ncbi:prolyl oligopeptidase family protein [Nocardia sp. NPDC058497]|uniref:prolyl oligopeptidase family serine peptidase n=1 Tax=Nocardia sp. NPDC058497 TaxID=3346529 RepID=UPI0036510D76
MANSAPAVAGTDPYRRLEGVDDPAVLAWAASRTAATRSAFGSGPAFDQLSHRILGMREDRGRIATPHRVGHWYYNLWRDKTHPRGLWRRTTLDRYRTGSPDWEVLLDLDALAEAETENWIWSGAAILRPAQSRALVQLSRGGSDAVEVREFDLTTRKFVADGFCVPAAKTRVSWIDENSIYVGTNFGDGSRTRSGYPRLAKRWHRGTPIADAVTVFEGRVGDICVSAGYDKTPGHERHYAVRVIDTARQEFHLLTDAGPVCLDLPGDAAVMWHRDTLVVATRSTWETDGTRYPAGAVLACSLSEFLLGEATFEIVFAPDERTALLDAHWTANHLLLTVMRDVRTQIAVATPSSTGWSLEWLPDPAPMTKSSIAGADPLDNDEFLIKSTGFTQPSAVFLAAPGTVPTLIKHSPAFFDADGMATEQYFAESADGTRVPYFVTRRAGATGPTLMRGYGGFGKSLLPRYDGAVGAAWLEDGGISVVANIRGGAEYGPAWHDRARRAGRVRAFEDFAAVARDLVDRAITTPGQLGATGRSNGGLLVGVMLTRYPELFGALACHMPLFDMARYQRLSAGASWIAEYGDPDDADDLAFLRAYSPYHHVEPGRAYPPVLITASSGDDRVHPGHARKMVARLEAAGHEVWYCEQTEGGHRRSAGKRHAARSTALGYEFFRRSLGLPSFVVDAAHRHGSGQCGQAVVDLPG